MAQVFDASAYGRAIADIYDDLYEATTIDTFTTEWAHWHGTPFTDAGGPRLSTFLERKAVLDQFREFATHRSIYHLKEADPHTWAIPRLRGRTKAALVEIQIDEYGGGRLERMHSELFENLELIRTVRAHGGREYRPLDLYVRRLPPDWEVSVPARTTGLRRPGAACPDGAVDIGQG
ncbi:Iron-containing redox enzyme [Streptosporangium subroseum]|uniref:Iron-containing redox enzyme n=1 Tax=Streptosporangium subroseum TaxID=106412 RepID=A0A239P9V8_9ACTN|nr:Iron-containing redox enzyme [Streptosporangium subroseum]